MESFVPPPQGTSDDYVARFGIGHRIGSGIGFEDSHTTFEMLLPFVDYENQTLLFGELRGILSNQAATGANAGLGLRHYLGEWDRTVGAFAHYDYRDTRNNSFHQVGFGFETLGTWDFRTNVYLPCLFEDRQPLANQFRSHYLFIDRAEAAMTGVDLEMGLPLPEIYGAHARVFGGYYHFQASGSPKVNGWKTRAEVQFANALDVDVSVQDDEVFGTTVNVGLVYYLFQPIKPIPPRSPYPPTRNLRRQGEEFDPQQPWRRLGEPVERLQNIVIAQQETLAADSSSGLPFYFLHVVPGAAGIGTFESPYGTLSQTMADPAAGTSLTYTPAGGAFTENVSLVDGATILSNGPAQYVSTQLGLQLLPFSATSTDLANLPGIVGNVTMANDSRLSGFDVTGGLSGTGISNVTIDNGRVTNSAGTAVSLTAISGQVTLTNLTASAGAAAGNKGIEITSEAADLTASLSNVSVTSAGGEGIDFEVTGAGDLTATVTNSSVTAFGNAFDATTADPSSGDMVLSLSDLTLASTNGGAGLRIGTEPPPAVSGTITVTNLANTTVTEADWGGMRISNVTFDSDLATAGNQQVNGGATVIGSSSTTTDVVGDGLRLTAPTGDLGFTTLDIYNDSGTGLYVDTKTDGTTFSLDAGSGSTIHTSRGSAMYLDPLTVNLNFDQVTSTAADTVNANGVGIFLDTVEGTINIGTTTVTNSEAQGIWVRNTPAAGLTASFGAATVSRTQAGVLAAAAVQAENNPTNTTITFSDLDITNYNGAGLTADTSGTVDVDSTDNADSTIAVIDGSAIDISNTTVNMNFDSVSAAGVSPGILLDETSGDFTVSGVGSATNSGGVINHVGGAGVWIDDSDATVSLNFMNLIDSTASASRSVYVTNLNNSSNVTVRNSVLTGTASDWYGIEVDSQNDGTYDFLDNEIGGTTGTNQQGIHFEINDPGATTPNATLTIDANVIVLQGGGAGLSAVNLSATGGATINPLGGAGNTATSDGVTPLTGTQLFDDNGTGGDISGTLDMNNMQVFP